MSAFLRCTSEATFSVHFGMHMCADREETINVAEHCTELKVPEPRTRCSDATVADTAKPRTTCAVGRSVRWLPVLSRTRWLPKRGRSYPGKVCTNPECAPMYSVQRPRTSEVNFISNGTATSRLILQLQLHGFHGLPTAPSRVSRPRRKRKQRWGQVACKWLQAGPN